MIDSVSLLIVTFNEESHIDKLLDALEIQTAKSKIYEILIADNGSTDKTKSLITSKQARSHLNIHWIERSKNNIGAARAELVRAARCSHLVFIDADCVPKPNWLDQLLQAYEHATRDSQTAGVGGPNRLPANNKFQNTVTRLLQNTPLHGCSSQSYPSSKIPSQGKRVDHIPTTNGIFCKQAILEVGNFSEDYSRVGEDLDLGLRLSRSGKKLYLYAEPEVINDSAGSLASWLGRMFRFGNAQGFVFGRRTGVITSFLLAMTTGLILSAIDPALFIFGVAFALLTSFFASFLTFCRAQANQQSFSLTLGFFVCALTPLAYYFGFLYGILLRAWRLTNIFTHAKPRPSH